MSYASFDHVDVITDEKMTVPKPAEQSSAMVIPEGVPPEVAEKLKPISVSKQSKAQTNPVKPTTYSPNIEPDARDVRDVRESRDARDEVVIAPPTHHIPSQHIPNQPIPIHQHQQMRQHEPMQNILPTSVYDEDDVYNVPPKDTYNDPLQYLYIPMLFAFFVVIVSVPAFSHVHIIVKASGALVFAFIVQYVISPF
jgi:hypothetical protein